jgi:predicted secreted hydrolase
MSRTYRNIPRGHLTEGDYSEKSHRRPSNSRLTGVSSLDDKPFAAWKEDWRMRKRDEIRMKKRWGKLHFLTQEEAEKLLRS